MSQEELDELDRTQPGWDRDARLAGCESGLQTGMARTALIAIYGEEIVREAEERIRKD